MQVARWCGGVQVCIIHRFCFSLLFFSAEEEGLSHVAHRKSRKHTCIDSCNSPTSLKGSYYALLQSLDFVLGMF